MSSTVSNAHPLHLDGFSVVVGDDRGNEVARIDVIDAYFISVAMADDPAEFAANLESVTAEARNRLKGNVAARTGRAE